MPESQVDRLIAAYGHLIHQKGKLPHLGAFTKGFQSGRQGESRKAFINAHENNHFPYFSSLLDIDDVDRIMHYAGTLSWSEIAAFIERIETSGAGSNMGWSQMRNMLIHVRLCVYLVFFQRLAKPNDYELLKELVKKASEGDPLSQKLMNLSAINITWEDFKCRNWNDAQTVEDVENEDTGDATAMIATRTGMSRHQIRSLFGNTDGFSIFTKMIRKVQNLRASTMPDWIVEQKQKAQEQMRARRLARFGTPSEPEKSYEEKKTLSEKQQKLLNRMKAKKAEKAKKAV